MKSNIADAILSLRPNAQFTYTNDDYSTIVWDVLEGVAPTQDEIDAEIIRLDQYKKDQAAQVSVLKSSILDRLGLTEEELKTLLS